MKVELDKDDLISLVTGTSPNYSEFENPLVRKSGYYVGGFIEKWEWNEYELRELSEKELFNLYNICKNSWK